MDQATVDKVLQVLREGATAATGAAKEGFTELCKYKSSVASAELVTAAIMSIVSAVAFGIAIRAAYKLTSGKRIRKFKGTWYTAPRFLEHLWKDELDKFAVKETEYTQEESLENHPGYLVALFATGAVFIISVSVLAFVGPELFATWKNPAGAVISDIVRR